MWKFLIFFVVLQVNKLPCTAYSRDLISCDYFISWTKPRFRPPKITHEILVLAVFLPTFFVPLVVLFILYHVEHLMVQLFSQLARHDDLVGIVPRTGLPDDDLLAVQGAAHILFSVCVCVCDSVDDSEKVETLVFKMIAWVVFCMNLC